MKALTRITPVLVAATLALTACGGNDNGGSPGPTGSTSSATGSPTAPASSPTLDASAQAAAYGVEIPAGLVLTAPGSTLAIGGAASIAWAPRKGAVDALKITVSRVRQGTIKDFAGFTINEPTKASTPFYVDATVTNTGSAPLTSTEVPLYVVDAHDTLLGPNAFGGTFQACHPNVLPTKLAAGKSAKVCLVYLAPDHGTFVAVSFRPSQEFNPITWTGTVQTPAPSPTAKPTKKKH